MSRRFWLASACCLGLATAAGCSKADDAGTATTGSTTTATQPVRVTGVQLGRAVGTDMRVTDETDDFKANETIYASVATDGTAPNATLTARWTYQDGQVVDSTTRSIAPNGPAATQFQISKPDGFPKGNYKVEILLNGAVTQSKDFEVGD
jgi:hypothetical protein